jgi:hypothetical protein
MIKHFLKWIELVPLLDHSSEGVAYAFLDMVFNRFGALVKILINKGMKFHGEFHCMDSKKFVCGSMGSKKATLDIGIYR